MVKKIKKLEWSPLALWESAYVVSACGFVWETWQAFERAAVLGRTISGHNDQGCGLES